VIVGDASEMLREMNALLSRQFVSAIDNLGTKIVFSVYIGRRVGIFTIRDTVLGGYKLVTCLFIVCLAPFYRRKRKLSLSSMPSFLTASTNSSNSR
jgi:hypothetical protein